MFFEFVGLWLCFKSKYDCVVFCFGLLVMLLFFFGRLNVFFSHKCSQHASGLLIVSELSVSECFSFLTLEFCLQGKKHLGPLSEFHFSFLFG